MDGQEFLEHYGVKGMKWGVRRPVGPDGRVVKKKSRARKELESAARELKATKKLKNASKMSNEELQSTVNRLRNENELKRLAKGKKREEFLNRSKMSDKELQERVNRLRLEDELKKQVKGANQDKINAANKLINQASDVALSSLKDDKGNFSATGSPIADTIIRESLKYGKSNKVIK